MQEEVTQKTIALSMKTGKLTAQALQAALKKYLQHRAKGPKLHHGKQSLKQLKAHGAALTNIEVTEANIGAFKPCAKKYGVDFTLRKDKTTQPPHYIVIFKAKDADNLEQAFREFTAKTLSKEQRPSIRKVLAAAKQKAAQQPKRASHAGPLSCRHGDRHGFPPSGICRLQHHIPLYLLWDLLPRNPSSVLPLKQYQTHSPLYSFYKAYSWWFR